jgi:hypothetical protein
VIEALDVQYLKRHLHANNVVLFLGAGFSTAATNSSGETLPASKALAKRLWEYMEYRTPYDGSQLGIVYQAALHKPGGQKNLVQLLSDIFTVKEFPDWYCLVINFFWY